VFVCLRSPVGVDGCDWGVDVGELSGDASAERSQHSVKERGRWAVALGVGAQEKAKGRTWSVVNGWSGRGKCTETMMFALSPPGVRRSARVTTQGGVFVKEA
jgi:hypothetical protein